MKEELVKFVFEKGLVPFDNSVNVKIDGESIYKTRDARAVHTKVLNNISSNFVFDSTSKIWNSFPFTFDILEIKRRQNFFKSLSGQSNDFLRRLTKPRPMWRPRYDIVVVTEDESTFVAINKLGCAVQLLVSENDILDLERYDIIQVIDCDDFTRILERLPQTVFINSIDDVYLERYLEELSGWRENFAALKRSDVSREISDMLNMLEPMFNLLDNKEGKIITESEVEKTLENINEAISVKIKELTISGEGLMKMLGEGKMPEDILKIVRGAIESSGLNEQIFNMQIPVSIDYKELEDQIKKQSATEFTNLAERVKASAESLKKVPKTLERLSSLILVEDFCLGIIRWMNEESRFPMHSDSLIFSGAKNILINRAQPINFRLDNHSKCSILTGANSGGKTTLLEHILQNISLFQLGLPIIGEIQMPIFTDVYYFAKNKGSTSKGAFETLLTQMSKIKINGSAGGLSSKFGDSREFSFSSSNVLILADEIESVTEPGVAGKIISATAEFFIDRGCFVVLATHLGFEIQRNLPRGARIDGIEAKGLDENFNLIVDHNPVLGRLAHSTPELIVEKMANLYDEEYFRFLQDKMKN